MKSLYLTFDNHEFNFLRKLNRNSREILKNGKRNFNRIN